jgi:hypothetical protein
MLRTLCLTPAIAAICGIGLISVYYFRNNDLKWKTRSWISAAVVYFICAGFLNWLDLYRWTRDPEVYEGLNGPIVDLARAARGTPPDAIAFIPRFHYEHRTFQFMLLSAPHDNVRPYGGEDGRDWSFLAPGELMASPGRPVQERWVYVTAANGLYQPLAQFAPEGYVVSDFKGAAGNTWALIYAIPESHLPKPADVAQTAAAWPRDLRH